MNIKDQVAAYIAQHHFWSEGLEILRMVMLDAGLEEDFKWSLPTYTFQGKNIAGLGATKKYLGIWFFQGGLLTDPQKVLVNAQEGKTKAMRQWRFNDASEINTKVVKAYVLEAMKNSAAGKVIKPQRKAKLQVPVQLAQILDTDHSLKEAFVQLSLSKRRDYAEYIATAKQEHTKVKRLEKIMPMIKNGIGLNDKYK